MCLLYGLHGGMENPSGAFIQYCPQTCELCALTQEGGKECALLNGEKREQAHRNIFRQ